MQLHRSFRSNLPPAACQRTDRCRGERKRYRDAKGHGPAMQLVVDRTHGKRADCSQQVADAL